MQVTRVTGIMFIAFLGAAIAIFLMAIAHVSGLGWYILGAIGGGVIAILLYALAAGKS